MRSFGFGSDLSLRARRTGSAPAAVSAITSLQVLDSTRLPDGADAAVPNGWVARVTLPDDGVSSFDPTKIVLTVADPGFTSAGAATTVTRTITGTAIVRRQYPNQAQRLNSVSAGVRTVYVALSDRIFASSTISAASANAGYYGGALAGVIAGVTNSSTRTYPKPNFGFVQIPNLCSGSTFYIEGIAGSTLARNGQQVACVEYYAKDSQGLTNTTPSAFAGAPTLSTLITSATKPEVYAATLNVANLAQGDLCHVHAKVYPWIGDAPFDLAVDGTAPPAPNPDTPLRFVCDRLGTYGGARAYVRTTGTLAGSSTAGVFLTDQTGLTNAQCYPTVQAAAQAIQVFNAAPGGGRIGHNDVGGGRVYLQDNAGAAQAHVLGSTSARTAGTAFLEIAPDPNNAALASISVTGGNTGTVKNIAFRCKVAAGAPGNLDLGGATSFLILDGMTFDQNGATVMFGYQAQCTYHRNVTYDNLTNDTPFTPLNAINNLALMAGCANSNNPGGGITVRAGIFAGNTTRKLTFVLNNIPANSFMSNMDGGLMVNNRIFDSKSPNGVNRVSTKGFTILQNVSESTSVQETFQIFGDGNALDCRNANIALNTMPASAVAETSGRTNHAYTDDAASAGAIKEQFWLYNLVANWNIKTDTFTTLTTVTGRTGNWLTRYSAGSRGNCVWGDQNAAVAADQSGGNWIGEVNPGVVTGAVTAFVDNRSGNAGAGAGDYHLTGASHAAYGLVAAGMGAVKYDILGGARRVDGSGAAGAHER
jgi:hypothetical protein